jgi:uncharacterized cupin superfamily protein
VASEARLEETTSGLVPATEGWFVVNVAEAAWETNDAFGAACFFEGDNAAFAQIGVNIRVLSPGRTRVLYHAESMQEDFLVLAGECLLLIEQQTQVLGAWDFVHCPPWTAHAFVARGKTPCVMVMIGARRGSGPNEDIVYPRSELALHHGVGVERESRSPEEVLAHFPRWQRRRPNDWEELPWARPRG